MPISQIFNSEIKTKNKAIGSQSNNAKTLDFI